MKIPFKGEGVDDLPLYRLRYLDLEIVRDDLPVDLHGDEQVEDPALEPGSHVAVEGEKRQAFIPFLFL